MSPIKKKLKFLILSKKRGDLAIMQVVKSDSVHPTTIEQ